jgi:hypothetical protein
MFAMTPATAFDMGADIAKFYSRAFHACMLVQAAVATAAASAAAAAGAECCCSR